MGERRGRFFWGGGIIIKASANVSYREVQRPRQPLWWLLVLLVAGCMWYSFVQQIIFDKPFGSNPAPDALLIVLWVIFGIAFPILMLAVTKLIVEVREDGLYIRFVPLHRRYKPFLYNDIVHYEVISYSPLKRFGGWGIRMNAQGETAYNMNGNDGLELKLRNQTVVIGSLQPEALKKAVDAIGLADKS